VSASAARISQEFCSGFLGSDEGLLLFKICEDFEEFVENVRETYVAVLVPACLKVRIQGSGFRGQGV
jgi:hypothetical protein